MLSTTAPRHGLAVSTIAVATSLLVISCGGSKDATSIRVGPPASLTIVSGDAQSSVVGQELPQPVVVKVVDANGHAVAGQAVNFRVTAGGGSVFAGASITNAGGIAQERWTLGTVAGAPQTLEARAVDNGTGQALVFATFHATSTPEAAAILRVVTQPSTTAQSGRPLATQPTVQVADKYGNAVQRGGVQVTAAIASSASGAALTGTIAVNSDNTGLATFTDLATSGPAGPITLSFTATGLIAATSASVALSAGLPAQLVAVGQTNFTAMAGAPLTTLPRVVVRDAAGNAVPGVTVNFSLTTNGGTISPTSVTSDGNGEAALTSWVLPTQTGTAMLIVSASAIPNATVTFAVTTTPGAASHLVRTDNTSLTAPVGTALPIALRVTDEYGNAIANIAVTFAVGANSGNVSAPNSPSGATVSVNSDASGSVNATWTLGSAAVQQTLVASMASGANLTLSATAQSGAAARLIAVGSTSFSGIVGTLMSTLPRVAVKDAAGNPVAGVTVSYQLTNAGGSIAPASVTTDANGEAALTTWLLPTAAGSYTLTASASGLSGSPVIFTVTGKPAAASVLTAVSAIQISGTAGTSAPLVVKVADSYGNVVAGATVTWAVVSGSATLSGSSSTSASDGTTQVTASLPSTTGTSQVTATLSDGSPVTFTISSTSGAAAKLAATTSTTLSGVVGSRLPDSFVEVTDNLGNPVAGVSVTFTGSSGSNVATATVATDAKGLAGFQWTLPTAVGTYTVTASATGLAGSPVRFTASATPGSASRIEIISGNNYTDTVGKVAPPLVVKVRDSYGNIVPNATVSWRATTNSGGGAPSLSTSASTTGQDGTTQIIATLQTQTGATNVGAAQVIASVGSGASVTFTLTAVAGAPASLKVLYGDQQTGTVNMQLRSLLAVHVADQYGNPVDALVKFVVVGGGEVLPATSQSGSGGTTATQWTLGPTVGTQSVAAEVGSLSQTFTATANALPTLSWSDSSLTAPGTFQIFETVSGVSASAVVMGGSDNRVVRFDGTTWRDLGPVSNASYLTIQSVWMSPVGDIYGVGVSGTPTQHGVIEWYAGGVWHETASLGGDLYGIWGASGGDIFAVGANGTILHFSGVTNTWSKMSIPTSSVFLRGVWGTGSADVFAVGFQGTILHYNGSAWTQMASPVSAAFTAVWGRSSTDVFAVGEGGQIVHYDGVSWKALQSGTTNNLTGVGGTPLGNVFATGYNGTLLSYDGRIWSQVPIAASSGSLTSVWGSPTGEVFAVGDPWRLLRGAP